MNLPTVALPDGTERMDDGGRDALVELHRGFDVDAAALFDAWPDSPEVAAHCARDS